MFLQSLSHFFQYAVGFFAVVWLLAAIANRTKRGNLKNKLSTIVSIPSVYTPIKENGETKDIEFYPRANLERAAQAWRLWFVTPVEKMFSEIAELFLSLQTNVLPKSTDENFEEKSNTNFWKVFNYFILLLLVLGYLCADAIIVVNTLESFGIIPHDFPTVLQRYTIVNIIVIFFESLLQRYDIAILFGSLISVILGGIIANDIFGDGDFTDWNVKRESKWGWFGKFVSVLLIFSGIYVIASLGAARYGRLVAVSGNVLSFLQDNGQFVINILTPINAALATALIAEDAFNKGGKILVLMALAFLLGVLAVIWYFVGAIYGTIVYLVDVLWRLVLGASGIAVFFMLTPLDDVVEKIQSRK